jgi:hypothetical protein
MAQTTLIGRVDRAAMAAEIKERRRELGSGQVTGGATLRSAARASEDRSTRVVFAMRPGLGAGQGDQAWARTRRSSAPAREAIIANSPTVPRSDQWQTTWPDSASWARTTNRSGLEEPGATQR